MYVVDSIVKNVGTPYTLFLGRNMYQTFMNAYTLVDSQTRRKLDEMLKTWKEPVPGSLDTRPVFPPEITRSIESALIKARTAALQQQQARSQQEILTRGRNGTPPGWSSTPTPPQNLARYPPVSSQTVPAPYQRNGAGHAYPPSVSFVEWKIQRTWLTELIRRGTRMLHAPCPQRKSSNARKSIYPP